MIRPVSDIAFTPAVKRAQEIRGSRDSYQRMEQRGGWEQEVTPELAAFIDERDSFYMATASADGQPYIQHRGGEKGFLKVIDNKTLAFADFVGNAQYISVGNLDENNKAFIFLMDYTNRRRIKLWGTASVIEDDAELLRHVTNPSYSGKPERVIVFSVEAWDVNCPQHITPRWTKEEQSAAFTVLENRIAELEEENELLRRVSLNPKSTNQANFLTQQGTLP